ncbi:AAA family ATPase [Roseomonas rosulenta]|uniref:AAA family ATPase n=1 Tax=Roseomonas rosulenta TaxID=2748667 RepID=UPI0018DFDFAC|nr:AAA family ATPase [Roseomonas rosulenta]
MPDDVNGDAEVEVNENLSAANAPGDAPDAAPEFETLDQLVDAMASERFPSEERREAYVCAGREFGCSLADLEQFVERRRSKRATEWLRQEFEKARQLGERRRKEQIENHWQRRAQSVDLDALNPPPRPWVMERLLIEGGVTVLIGAGAGGKTSLAIGAGLSVATGLPLLGWRVHRPGSVWFMQLEDDRKEFDRRMKAATTWYHNDLDMPLSNVDLGDGRKILFATEKPHLVSMKIGKAGAEAEINEQACDSVVAFCRANDVRLLVVDPLLRTHNVPENSNEAMDTVLQALVGIAGRANCAILVLHHTRKGSGADGSGREVSGAARGAVVITDAARAAFALMPMDKKLAGTFEPKITDEQHGFYVSLVSAKENYLPRASSTWFRFEGVPLRNGDEYRPEGDTVQVLRRVHLVQREQQPQQGLTAAQKLAALRIIAREPSPGERWTRYGQKNGNRRVVPVLAEHLGLPEPVVKAALDGWVSSGVVREEKYTRPRPSGAEASGLIVDRDALSAAEQAAGGSAPDDDDLPF